LQRTVVTCIESAVGEIGEGGPKIPQGKIIFSGKQSHVAVDAFILLAIIRFGGKDWDNARVEQLQDDLAQVFSITRFKMRADLDDHKGRAMDAQFTFNRRLSKGTAILAAVPLCPQQCPGSSAILRGGSFAAERALKVGDHFAQFKRKAGKYKRVGFKHSEKFSGPALAIAEDRKRMWIVPKPQPSFIDLAQAGIYSARDDGQVFP